MRPPKVGIEDFGSTRRRHERYISGNNREEGCRMVHRA
jgi:hypothetical protein